MCVIGRISSNDRKYGPWSQICAKTAWNAAKISCESEDFVGTWFPGSRLISHPAPKEHSSPKTTYDFPLFRRSGKRINEINMTGTRQTGVKQRLRNKHRQSVIMEICTILISLCQILSFHYLFPGAKDTFLDFIEKKILFLVELNVKMFKILFLVELTRKCFLVQLYAKLLKKDFSKESKMIYTDSGMVPKGSGMVGLGS